MGNKPSHVSGEYMLVRWACCLEPPHEQVWGHVPSEAFYSAVSRETGIPIETLQAEFEEPRHTFVRCVPPDVNSRDEFGFLYHFDCGGPGRGCARVTVADRKAKQ